MTRGDKFDGLVKMYEEGFKDHALTSVVPLYRIGRANSGMYASWIAFLAERIVIFGDATVGGCRNNGVISDVGYNLEWFTSDLDPDYLCSKFLDREWDADSAEEWVRDEMVKCPSDDEMKEGSLGDCLRWTGLQRIRDAGDYSEQAFMSEGWADLMVDCDDGPSPDYNTAHAAMLIVIQRTFRRLWLEQLQRTDQPAEVPESGDLCAGRR